MNDSIEFTAREKFQISLFKNVDALFKQTVFRALRFIVPSVILVAYYIYSHDIVAGLVGYGLLLFQAIHRLTVTKKGLRTTAIIHQKYEAQLQRLGNQAEKE